MWPIIKIEVQDEEIKIQQTDADSQGETRDLPYQNVYVHVHGQPYPSKQKAFIPKDRRDDKRKPIPFAKGWYQLDVGKVFVGYGKATFGLGQMIPAPQQKPQGQ